MYVDKNLTHPAILPYELPGVPDLGIVPYTTACYGRQTMAIAMGQPCTVWRDFRCCGSSSLLNRKPFSTRRTARSRYGRRGVPCDARAYSKGCSMALPLFPPKIWSLGFCPTSTGVDFPPPADIGSGVEL